MPTTLLTGPPRSGTTLLTALLNDVPDTIGLSEPMRFANGDVARAVREISAFVANVRHDALNGRPLPGTADVVHESWFEPPKNDRTLRAPLAKVVRRYDVTKSLSANFNLFVKHPAAFSALASSLAPVFPIAIIVRDPLMTLCAWQSVNIPLNNGRLPNAEKFRPELKVALDAIPDATQRQVKVMEMLLGWYLELPQAIIIRYEDLVRAPRETLGRLVPKAPEPTRRIYVNDLSRYLGADIARTARALVRIAPLIERFYPDFSKTLAKYAG